MPKNADLAIAFDRFSSTGDRLLYGKVLVIGRENLDRAARIDVKTTEVLNEVEKPILA